MFEKPALGKLRDKFPLGVVKVFETSLSSTPSARYASCSEFVAALDAAITAPEAAATRLATPMPTRQADALPVPERAPASSNRWLVWVVGVILVAGVVALAVKLFSPAAPVVTPAPAPKTVEAPVTPVPAPAPPKAVQGGNPGKAKTATAKDTTKKEVTKTSKPASGESTTRTVPDSPAPVKQAPPEKSATPAEQTPPQPQPPKPIKLVEPDRIR